MWSEISFVRETLPDLMLEYPRDRVSDRKLRLIACACCRRNPVVMADRLGRWKVDVVERYLDGLADPQEFEDAGLDSGDRTPAHLLAVTKNVPYHLGVVLNSTANAVAADRVGGWGPETRGAGFVARDAERLELAAIVRCVAGPLAFRPVASSTAWQTSTARTLARQMYEAREFSAMPILADALQDAGCDSDDILDHCRNPGPHVRGCWACDLVLGKE